VNEVDAWILLDGPEPEHVRAFLDALRDPMPPTPEDKARSAKSFFEALDAELGYEAEPPDQAPANPHAAHVAPAVRFAASPVAPAPVSVPVPSAPMPSARYPAPVPLPPTPPAALLPQVVPAPAALATTAQLDPRTALPNPAAAVHFPPEAPARPRASATLSSELRRDQLPQTTTPLGDNSLSDAVASFLGNTKGTGTVEFPRLELNEYASLKATLDVHPERAKDILPRYYVFGDAAHRALDEHWKKRLAARPLERAVFDDLLARYKYGLRSQAAQRR
jgi:hypothetical protein